MNASDPARITRPGLLSRLKLSEPVRLYAWPLVLVLVVSAVAGGVVTQEWADWALPQLLAALGTLGAAEAGRASVYSPRTHVQDLLRSRGSWSVSTALDADLRPAAPRAGARP